MSVKFQSRKVDSSIERLICTGIIASDKVLGQLSHIIIPEIMTDSYSGHIVRWCLDYYVEFEKAPRAHIRDIFESHKKDYFDEDVIDLIAEFLGSINAEFAGEELQEDYIISEAEKYIKLRSVQILCDDVKSLVNNGRIDEAQEKLASYSAPQLVSTQAADIFSDSFWAVNDDQESEILFRYPGALDDLIGPIMRDSFIAFLAAEKVGKTWQLLYAALTALRQRCNVIFFSCGDMTERQMRQRIGHMLTGHDPKRQRDSVLFPILDCRCNQVGKCPIGEDTDSVLLGKGKDAKIGSHEDFPEHIVCTRCYKDKQDKRYFEGAVWHKEVIPAEVEKSHEDALAALKKRAGSAQFKLLCYPPDTLTVAEISNQLDLLEKQENFKADVIVIDYADLLAPELQARRLEYRHQINSTWMALRRLSQVRCAAVLTATQAKIDVRKTGQVEQWHTSEDKRKLAHVTAMLGLNQTPADKRSGIIKINNLATRDSDFDVQKQVVVLQCLALGKPYTASYMNK